MRIVKLSTFADFDSLFDSSDWQLSALFRGVSDSRHELTPSLFRIDTRSDYSLIESNLMWLFKAQARPHLERVPSSDLEWLVIAQHHGLPTRLLDWTLSPLIGLFFAVRSLAPVDGALYVYDRESFAPVENCDLTNLSEVQAIFPPHEVGRVVAQQGMFTVHPNSQPTLDDQSIVKAIIPVDSKAPFMAKLLKYGVHDATVYPDLDGLARYIRMATMSDEA
jgi:hypothetical protein